MEQGKAIEDDSCGDVGPVRDDTSDRHSLSRRGFVQGAGLLGAGIALGVRAAQAQETGQQQPQQPAQSQGSGKDSGRNPQSGKRTGATGPAGKGPSAPRGIPTGSDLGEGEIPRRPLGKTGVQISALGMGGHHLGDAETVNEAMDLVHQAIDYGITFFDNCWEYDNGKTEDWLGRALASDGRRDKIFLMTKVCTHGRSADLALKMLEESLRRLQTDHVDLWQIHAITYDNDPELAYAKGGVIEALDEAKKQGKARFVGFTGHKHPQIHLRMLALADQRGVKFDTVQMPLNPFDASYRSFAQYVLPEALKRGMGVIGMKSLGGNGEPIQQGAITVKEALRYAMSLPVSVTVSGIDSLQVLRQNLSIARDFQPMTPQEMLDLATRCATIAADGHLEMYKSTKKYDASEGRKQHGYPTQEELPM